MQGLGVQNLLPFWMLPGLGRKPPGLDILSRLALIVFLGRSCLTANIFVIALNIFHLYR
jgi:hypothetical protein